MTRHRFLATPAACLWLCAIALFSATPTTASEENPNMRKTGTGTFKVELTPLSEGAREGGWSPQRTSIDKRFQGDLEGLSRGEMMAAITAVKGSAGYVASERVEGVLDGRRGAFVLQHYATMRQGTPEVWRVEIVPDSGEGELRGIDGEMKIEIEAGVHRYTLTYRILPEGD